MPCFIPEPAPFFSRDWHSDPETEMILFCGRDIIVQEENGVCVLPRAADVAGVLPCEALKVGEAGGRRLFAAEPEELPEELPGGLTRIPFRTAAGKLDRNVCPAVFRGRE